MRKLGFLFIMGMATLWANEEVTIQVINAIHEKSVTREFDVKLKKSGLEVHKNIESGRYVVTLGTFKDEKSAESALKKVRHVVAHGAFIRPVKRDSASMVAHAPIKEVKSTDAHAPAQKHTEMTYAVNKVETVVHDKAKASEVTTHAKPDETTTDLKTVQSPLAAEVKAQAGVESKPVVAVTSPIISPVVPVISPIVIAAQQKAMRKDEIAEAIQFYKTSPYHRFEPVMLQH